MLSLNDVSKSFDGIHALNSISLSVPEGQTTILIGPSGCGKSTILRLIIGLIGSDTGSIVFNGENIDPKTALPLRLKMGYVIQEGGLFPHLTSFDNITLMASHLGWVEEQKKERVKRLVDLTQFPEDGLNRYPAQLSGGQRQRVSLMRALMLDPELLLMDEPLGALDPMIRVDLQSELKSIFRKLKKTVLLVTHDLGEAAFLGNILVLMRDGIIVQEGSLDELMKSPAESFVTRFINAQRYLI